MNSLIKRGVLEIRQLASHLDFPPIHRGTQTRELTPFVVYNKQNALPTIEPQRLVQNNSFQVVMATMAQFPVL